jgi:hypothetical protein
LAGGGEGGGEIDGCCRFADAALLIGHSDDERPAPPGCGGEVSGRRMGRNGHA